MRPAERLRLLAGDQDLYEDMLGAAAAGYKPPLYNTYQVAEPGGAEMDNTS